MVQQFGVTSMPQNVEHSCFIIECALGLLPLGTDQQWIAPVLA